MIRAIKRLLQPETPRFSLKTHKKHTWTKPNGHDTNIQVYNCNVKSLVPLIINNKNCITWYTCGPTVYDSSHIGHGCCYVKVDIIQKILRRYFKYNVVSIMNITDIDDKIIRKAQELKSGHEAIAKQYEEEFWMDMGRLNVVKPDYTARVSNYIPEIISFIAELLRKNKAYESDGSVYFRADQCKTYEKFVDVKPGDTVDFALWKAHKPNEPYWTAPWGRGRPAWHIECSTIAGAIIGACVDIHSGGLDIRFPHHQNEEAQSCELFEREQWVNNWLHVGSLKLDRSREKMSKSLGNGVSIDELLREYTSEEFRMACCLSHYRAEMRWTNGLMASARARLEKIMTSMHLMDSLISDKVCLSPEYSKQLMDDLNRTVDVVDEALRCDFNVPKVIESLVDLINNVQLNVGDRTNDQTAQFTNNSFSILAIRNFIHNKLFELGIISDGKQQRFDDVVELIVSYRAELRGIAAESRNKDIFQLCDRLRDDLKRKRIEVKDVGRTSKWIDMQK